jgi:hypothetical protein
VNCRTLVLASPRRRCALQTFQFREEGGCIKQFWKKHLDRITNNVVENHETYTFGAVVYGFIAVSGFAHYIFRHTAGLENYWLISSALFSLLAIVHVYFLARAKAARRLREHQTK